MKNNKYTIGILGLGEGRSTISAALSSEKLELGMICDLNEDMCKKRAEEFNFPNYTTSYETMLANPEIDIIGIYTPDKLHAGHIRMALEEGKHVVSTKPLMDNLDQASELLKLQEKSGKKVFVGQSSRFFEPMMRQRMDFEKGILGNIITIETHYNADHRWFLEKPWAREESFKWLFGGLSHPVDLLRWYMPDIEEVMGYGLISENGRKGGLKNEDTMHFILKTASGSIAQISGSYSGPVQPHTRSSQMSCIIRGTEACSQADYPDLRYALTSADKQEQLITFDHRSNHYFRFEGHSHHAGEYQNYLDYFVDCLSSGQTAYPDLKEGIGTVAVMQAMEKSLKSGKPEKVKYLW